MIEFSDETITNGQMMVHSSKNEYCGNMSEDGKTIINITNGKTDRQGRKMCEHEEHRVNYHTHPAVSKSYPSGEDLVKIIAQRKEPGPPSPSIEILFTKWGIWQMIAVVKTERDASERRRMAERITKKVLDPFYHDSEKGRAEKIDIKKIIKFINAIKSSATFYGATVDIQFSFWTTPRVSVMPPEVRGPPLMFAMKKRRSVKLRSVKRRSVKRRSVKRRSVKRRSGKRRSGK